MIYKAQSRGQGLDFDHSFHNMKLRLRCWYAAVIIGLALGSAHNHVIRACPTTPSLVWLLYLLDTHFRMQFCQPNRATGTHLMFLFSSVLPPFEIKCEQKKRALMDTSPRRDSKLKCILRLFWPPTRKCSRALYFSRFYFDDFRVPQGTQNTITYDRTSTLKVTLSYKIAHLLWEQLCLYRFPDVLIPILRNR